MSPSKLTTALIGALLGNALWAAAAGLLPEADSSRWALRGSSVPIEVSGLAGALADDPAALNLWSYRGASPRARAFRNGTILVDARVPDDAQLRIRLGADAATSGPDTPTRPMTPLLSGAARPGVDPRGGPPRPPRPPDRGVSVLIDRSARAAISATGLRCDASPAPDGERFTLRIDAHQGALALSVDGRPVARCNGDWPAGDVVFSSGVRRIALHSVSLIGDATFADTFDRFPRGPLARVLAVVAGLVGGLLVGRRSLAIAGSPLLALPLLALADMRGWLDALRLLAVPECLGPLLFAGVPALAALLVLAARLPAPAALAAAIAPVVVTAVCAIAARWPHDAPGWLILAALALPWTALSRARRPAASVALTALLFVQAEVGVRLTALDASWTRTAGWRRASEEFRELLELQTYRAYPDEGFPVRPPAADPTRRRIVALGGSSTGGAYQMDDIDQFWPKRLEETLAGTDWEVVNQGVGGWNSLHVRLYVESQIERLDADVLAIYVGHNDVLAQSPVPYRDLYARYRANTSSVRVVSDALHASRLYVGLKFAVLSLRDSSGAIAVPVADARENLAAVIRVATAHNARVLLMTEGLNPDPLPLAPYGAMQRALAEETGSRYLDAADALWRRGDPELFLDDCHLSASGHRALAADVQAALREAGWL